VAGWWVTEIGRQPYVVYGVLGTADVVAQHPPQLLAFTVLLYMAMYIGLIISYVWVLRYMLLGGIGSSKKVNWGGVPTATTPADKLRREQ